MPQDGVSKYQSERQVVHQRFQRAAAAGLRKIRMHPAPVISVAVAAVVALDAKAQRLAVNFFPIKNNLAGKGAVWIDDVMFEVVSAQVPSTDIVSGSASGPRNLSLEEAPAVR